jgi:hypothetical protein
MLKAAGKPANPMPWPSFADDSSDMAIFLGKYRHHKCLHRWAKLVWKLTGPVTLGSIARRQGTFGFGHASRSSVTGQLSAQHASRSQHLSKKCRLHYLTEWAPVIALPTD